VTTQTTAAKAYQQQAVLTASKEKLVVMLFDGALRNIDRASRGLETNDVPGVGEALSKAFAIVGELRSSLDREKGEDIATNLERLYGFIQDRIVLANRDREQAPLDEARSILMTVKEGFDAVVGS